MRDYNDIVKRRCPCSPVTTTTDPMGTPPINIASRLDTPKEVSRWAEYKEALVPAIVGMPADDVPDFLKLVAPEVELILARFTLTQKLHCRGAWIYLPTANRRLPAWITQFEVPILSSSVS